MTRVTRIAVLPSKFTCRDTQERRLFADAAGGETLLAASHPDEAVKIAEGYPAKPFSPWDMADKVRKALDHGE